jgi:heterogeneous nuclear ribonucleoprotein A1/A3
VDRSATQFSAVLDEIKAVASVDVTHRKVFVRGLAWETKTEHLKEAFSVFGDVQEGAVIFDKSTGKSRGYGFVTFVDMEAAQRAVDQQTIAIQVRLPSRSRSTRRLTSGSRCLPNDRAAKRRAT